MPNISSAQIESWIERFAAHIAEQKDYLTQLDAAIGDADHGANMHRGMKAVLAKKAETQNSDIGGFLKMVAMTLISTVGGASGALYGTFFLQASSSAASKTELSPAEFGALLDKGLAGIVLRGKAAIGDKTMVDSLQPGIKAYKRSLEAGEPLKEALAAALTAADEGLKSTIPLVARRGRASYLGERSAGHADPGATSTVLLFRSAAESLG
ncbi:MAG TPA: dihydroxyacetone kinase subunit DhaL [Chthoniobacterales bacterium]|nr:dihydroxyacetone kinase subunit DhaL [Chthoniobacterales bacterium]